MSTPDPFGDALAQRAQGDTNPDPYGAALAAQAALDEPKKDDKPDGAWKRAMDQVSSFNPVGGALTSMATDAASNIGATGAILKGLVSGDVSNLGDASRIAEKFKADHPGYTPPDNSASSALVKGASSPLNPINWPGALLDKGGDLVSKGLDAAGVSSNISTAAGPIASGAAQVGLGALGAIKGFGGSAKAEPTVAPTASTPAAPFDSPPIEGGLPDTAQTARAQVLQRVGLDNARVSALAGNAKDAATDWQLSKFDEPAGVEAKTMFNNEKAALTNHATNIVENTGGTVGTDEDTLNSRGRTIAAPFDQLSDWFDNQRKALYSAADQRAGGGPITKLEGTQELLNSPEFKNTLLAKDQGNLLSGIQNQLKEFQSVRPDGFNVADAEKVRQWLNTTWTNTNKGTIGQVKAALDDDVMKGAGEDIYGPARALQQMKYQTLDNPDGIARLMDRDPQTPINRTTPYAKIPDTLTRLDPDQFTNVIKTLDTMPQEIQPAAQAAKSEIQAHLANKLLDAGTSTQGQWNTGGVAKVLKANSAKFQAAFDDKPQALQQIQDLDSAGKILKVDQSYPGAAAQAANALKRGFMSRAISKASSATGALVGSAAGGVVGAPMLGGAAGAALGETAGSALGQGMAERAALNRWKSGTVSLSDLLKGKGSP